MPSRRNLCCVVLVAAVLLTCQPAAAQPTPSPRRIALVIGNANYTVGKLRNPANDAEDMATMLRELNFEVTKHIDLKLPAMKEAIRAFAKLLRPEDAGLFYYAGHAMQVNGENYLIPVDADIQAESEVEYNAINLGFLLGHLREASNSLNVVILDACRNNPFRSFLRSSAGGLANTQAPSGTLIAFATAPDATAADGLGRNGIFTKHLLASLQIPGLAIEEVLKQTRIAVLKETQNAQTPWDSSSLTGDLILRSRPTLPPAIDVDRRSSLGTLEVTGSEGDAEVRLDGKAVGHTQGGEALTLSDLLPGKYQLEMVKEGFLPSKQEVIVKPGQVLRVRASLKRLSPEARPAVLRLSVKPGDASVYLDGNFIGSAAELSSLHDGLLVNPGYHELELIRPGRGPLQRSVFVEAGQELKLEIELRADVRP